MACTKISNAAKGPPVTGCWWHPYWDYVCFRYYRALSATDSSYGGTVAVRYEFKGGEHILPTYGLHLLDIGGQSESPQLDAFKVQYGARF